MSRLWNVWLSAVLPFIPVAPPPPPRLPWTTLLTLLLLWSSALFYSSIQSLITFQTCISVFLTLFLSLFSPPSLLPPFFSSSSSSCLHVWSSRAPMDHDIAMHSIFSSSCSCFWFCFYVLFFLSHFSWYDCHSHLRMRTLKSPSPSPPSVAGRPQLPSVASVWRAVWQLSCCPRWLCCGSHKLMSMEEKGESLSRGNLWAHTRLLSMPFWPLFSHTQD